MIPHQNSPLSQIDLTISDSLSAWIAALDLAPPSLPLSQAADHCVSLCKIFSQFAPNLLSDRDFFIPSNLTGPNAGRQRRYNTRRLARSLAKWFHLRLRSPSPLSNGSSANTVPPPLVQLSPGAAEGLLFFTDPAQTEEVEAEAALLPLAEVVLCAAVHSERKETYIKAVLTLSPVHQEALAVSIRRTSLVDRESTVLTPVTMRDENVMPSALSSSPMISERSFKEDTHATPRGIPLADYKALAAERDNLRRKLAATEAEKGKYIEEAEVLRTSLDEAGDTIRDLKNRMEKKENEIVTKAKALNDAKDELRIAHITVEEVDVLRAKAASAEQLEASLKRASKRLEDVANMRRLNKDLEQQLEAYRENEERMGKHTEYLESQLKSSNDRAQHLAVLLENMSSDLEQKEMANSQLKTENREFKEKLETANRQLASMLISTNSQQNSDNATTTYSSPSGGILVDGQKENRDEVVEGQLDSSSQRLVGTTTVMESSVDASLFDSGVVSNQLFAEIGVKMTWDDIVDCVRGVMDALKEMDGAEVVENSQQVSLFNELSCGALPNNSTDNSNKACSTRTQSGHSEESLTDSSSDTESRISIIPEFAVVDSKLASERGGGDEFDFAANEVNVQEIPANDADSGLGRRRSSQLATIPENREGFDTEESETGEESSYSSEYTSDTSEIVDETINATADKGGVIVPYDNTGGKEPRISPNEVPASRPDPPMIVDNKTASDILEHSADHMSARLCRSGMVKSGYNSWPCNVRRATSLTVSVLSSMRRTPSHSETRALVRQARTELHALQEAMEAMRSERQASASIGVLVKQLDHVRDELRLAQTIAAEKEAESHGIRKELNILIKEFDSLTMEKRIVEEREAGILQEKERLVQLLRDSLINKERELKGAKDETTFARKQVEALQASQKVMEEKLCAAEVISRAQEVELVRLNAKVEANEAMTSRLSAVVSKTDGWKSQLSCQRESHMQDMAEAVRREKQLAEEARDEARRVAKSHVNILNDMRATAAAAAMARSRDHERGMSSRKSASSRFGEFWRRLLHREKLNIDFTMPPSAISVPSSKETDKWVETETH